MDLLIGGDLGEWALDQVSSADVGHVYTVEPALGEKAKRKGFATCLTDVNEAKESAAVGISIHYPRILTAATLRRYRKVYNLHPGLLPWGRGFFPIFWALWEKTPAGATLHEVDERLDTGPIVAQLRVEATETDTGGSLFARVREAERKLFLDFFSKLKADEELPAKPQPAGGSYHSRQEFFDLKAGFDWRNERGEDLVRLVRCLTFPGYSGMEVRLGDTVFDLSLKGSPR